MVEFMEGQRTERLIRERHGTILKNLKLFDEAVAAIEPRVDGKPSLIDIAVGIPKVKTVIDSYPDMSITIKSFDFLKTALGNSNAAVRTSATKALVTVKLFAGPSK